MVVVARMVGLVERVALSIVPVLERLPRVALRPTVPLLAPLTSAGLIAAWLPIIRMAVVTRRTAVTAAARWPVAAAGAVGMRRFHCAGYRPRDSGCPWGCSRLLSDTRPADDRSVVATAIVIDR